MDSGDIGSDIRASIAHHMDDRKEKEEEIGTRIPHEQYDADTTEGDEESRYDKYAKVTVFLDPQRGDTEYVPDRQTDQ